ncbi:Uncharacterized protein TCM_043287 [Theobroma cacao]|uniref:Uncharacterized protein n=1 Tax=Theobroma cacao TaxID=3641 RepID=A0A061FPI1_THECC|nr:Uncharacterized protein TCM_043287 [Theobroma cacao]
MEVINGVLEEFYACSRQKVNVEKSLFYCSRNVGKGTINNLMCCFGFQYSDDLRKYPGVPLLSGLR